MDPDTKGFLERQGAAQRRDPYAERVFVGMVANLPAGPHWAIMFDTSTDDGYGGRRPAIEYEAFTDEKVWREHVEDAHRQHRAFRAMVVQPATVTVSVSVAPFEPLKRGGQ